MDLTEPCAQKTTNRFPVKTNNKRLFESESEKFLSIKLNTKFNDSFDKVNRPTSKTWLVVTYTMKRNWTWLNNSQSGRCSTTSTMMSSKELGSS